MISPQDSENPHLPQSIDHTKLAFAPGEDEEAAIDRLCGEAKTYGFYAVCVRPQHVMQAKRSLRGTPVKVATVIGFPAQKVRLPDELGQPTVGHFSTPHKVEEAARAIEHGADELDWVINVGNLKTDMAQNTLRVYDELIAARQVAGRKPVKVIIETDLLTAADIVTVTGWCAKAGMDMVKTSTGMVEEGQGATPENVTLIRETLEKAGTLTGIKASGGIKNREQALNFLGLGASRLGTSAGVVILDGGSPAASRDSY